MEKLSSKIVNKEKQLFKLIDISKGFIDNFFNEVKESKTRQELTDFRLKNTSGYWHWFSTNAVAIRDESGSVIGIAGTARDCNEDKEKQKQVEYLSFHDYLTGLYNRRYMEESVKKFDNEIYLPFTIICIDVNGLKLSGSILYHQERIDGTGYRIDGTGYPENLKGEKLPLLSKIIAVADAYEAMTSKRNYKKAMDKEQAIMELKRCAGTQFDTEIVQVFIEKVLK